MNERRRIRVSGIVQGVGFRPFVYQLAASIGLAGAVGNDSAGVFIEIEGERGALDEFGARLVGEAPPLARIDAVATESRPISGRIGFTIVAVFFLYILNSHLSCHIG